jgi:hypothetical protein
VIAHRKGYKLAKNEAFFLSLIPDFQPDERVESGKSHGLPRRAPTSLGNFKPASAQHGTCVSCHTGFAHILLRQALKQPFPTAMETNLYKAPQPPCLRRNHYR